MADEELPGEFGEPFPGIEADFDEQQRGSSKVVDDDHVAGSKKVAFQLFRPILITSIVAYLAGIGIAGVIVFLFKADLVTESFQLGVLLPSCMLLSSIVSTVVLCIHIKKRTNIKRERTKIDMQKQKALRDEIAALHEESERDKELMQQKELDLEKGLNTVQSLEQQLKTEKIGKEETLRVMEKDKTKYKEKQDEVRVHYDEVRMLLEEEVKMLTENLKKEKEANEIQSAAVVKQDGDKEVDGQMTDLLEKNQKLIMEKAGLEAQVDEMRQKLKKVLVSGAGAAAKKNASSSSSSSGSSSGSSSDSSSGSSSSGSSSPSPKKMIGKKIPIPKLKPGASILNIPPPNAPTPVTPRDEGRTEEDLQREVDCLKAELDRYQKGLTGSDQDMIEIFTTLTTVQKGLAEAEENLEQRDKELGEMESEVQEAWAKWEDLDRNRQELDTQLESKDEELGIMVQELQKKSEDCAGKGAECDEKEKALEAAVKELAAVKVIADNLRPDPEKSSLLKERMTEALSFVKKTKEQVEKEKVRKAELSFRHTLVSKLFRKQGYTEFEEEPENFFNSLRGDEGRVGEAGGAVTVAAVSAPAPAVRSIVNIKPPVESDLKNEMNEQNENVSSSGSSYSSYY